MVTDLNPIQLHPRRHSLYFSSTVCFGHIVASSSSPLARTHTHRLIPALHSHVHIHTDSFQLSTRHVHIHTDSFQLSTRTYTYTQIHSSSPLARTHTHRLIPALHSHVHIHTDSFQLSTRTYTYTQTHSSSPLARTHTHRLIPALHSHVYIHTDSFQRQCDVLQSRRELLCAVQSLLSLPVTGYPELDQTHTDMIHLQILYSNYRDFLAFDER